MGWLSDNTHSRFGRRKPYMVVGTVLYNTMLLFLLNPPRNMGHPAISHWFGMTYTLFYLFDTFTSIPYYAFGMELTNDFDERDQVWFWNQLSGKLGTLVGIFLPVPLTAMTSNLYDVWLITGLMFVIVHAGGMAANVLLIPEKPEEEKAATLGDDKENGLDLDDESGGGGSAKAAGSLPSRGPVQDPLTNATADPNPAPFVVNLLRCMRNEPFDKIIKSYFLDYLGLGMISAMLPFYVGYVLLRPEGVSSTNNKNLRCLSSWVFMVINLHCSSNLLTLYLPLISRSIMKFSTNKQLLYKQPTNESMNQAVGGGGVPDRVPAVRQGSPRSGGAAAPR